MQGGRGRGDPFFGFGDPFAGFGGMPSLFGGRDPFDDPFFTRPFGGMLQSSLFGPAGSPFMDMNPFGPTMNTHIPGIQERPSQPNRSRGPIIEELNSDDEDAGAKDGKHQKVNPRKHRRSDTQPYVEHPDDETEGREPKHTYNRNQFSIMNNSMHSRPQASSFTFQSSTVTYGSSNGAYYTSSTTKRDGSDGLRFEEHKEADTVTGKATHRVSKGIYDKGHTLTRNLNSDGQVNTMQMLNNINEDELPGFEEAWKGKARNYLPEWTGGTSTLEGSRGPSAGRRALPSNMPPNVGSMRAGMQNQPPSQFAGRTRPDANEHAQFTKVRRR